MTTALSITKDGYFLCDSQGQTEVDSDQAAAFLSRIDTSPEPEKEVLHPATAKLVQDFASALSEKLLKAQEKYGYSDNWKHQDWETECQIQLNKHVEKGDPLDVAAYAAFCWARGWKTI